MPLKSPAEVAKAFDRIDLGVHDVNKAFSDLADSFEDNFILIYLKAVLETYNQIIRDTPKDIGTARGNWQIDNKTNDTELERAITSPEELDLDGLMSELDPYKIIWIFNNLPYIEQLEAGYSPKGEHMVSNALNDLLVRLRTIAKEVNGFA
jgi:hypothetical protein